MPPSNTLSGQSSKGEQSTKKKRSGDDKLTAAKPAKRPSGIKVETYALIDHPHNR